MNRSVSPINKAWLVIIVNGGINQGTGKRRLSDRLTAQRRPSFALLLPCRFDQEAE